jgi:integrase
MGRPGKPRKEIWKSLGTSDPREAKRLSRPALDALELEFEALRRPRSLTEAELQDAIWRRYLEVVSTDERFRQTVPTSADLDEIWKHLEDEFGEYNVVAFRVFEDMRDLFDVDLKKRTARLKQLQMESARGQISSITDVLIDVMERRQIDIEPGTAGYRRLAQGLQRADIEALLRTTERDAGDFSGKPKDPLVSAPTVFDPPPGEQILELWDKYVKQHAGRNSADTWDQHRKVVALFNDFVGGKAHVSQITRKNVREWKDKLFHWPVKAVEIKVFRGMSFLKIIEHNTIVGKPTILPKTINRYLSALGGFTEWLRTHDYLTEDVMQGMYLDIDRSEKTIFPYTDTQLKAIFASPLFRRCAGEKREHEVGKEEVRDWRYWIPLIAIYSGARLGEIAQLLIKDVRQLHGVWIFHISEQGSRTKSVKTGGSERVVPVHSKLVEMGLLRFHARQIAFGQDRLFPELVPDKRGFISGEASSFFNDYFRAIGVKTDKTNNFHSLRHNAADAFRRAGFYDEQFNVLLGHTKATTTGKYGIMPEGILSERVKMIEAISYLGVFIT